MRSQKVPLFEKIGYSLGDCSANLVFQMMIYQAKFYTDVFGLKGAVAGSVLLIARIFKYFVILIVGVISDRTNTLCGKYISGEAVRNGGEGNFVCVELDFLNSHFLRE